VFLTIGALVGMVVGIIPGFGPSAGIAILMPLTFGMDPIAAVVMLAAIYYAAMYGGTITSILLNTPGESATVAATFDGYPLAQQGRAGPALVMQAVASFVGGTVGVILITLLAPLFSQLARGFGPPEYFLLAMMGMLCLVVMVGSDWRYGIISGLIGFALGTVGIDRSSGEIVSSGDDHILFVQYDERDVPRLSRHGRRLPSRPAGSPGFRRGALPDEHLRHRDVEPGQDVTSREALVHAQEPGFRGRVDGHGAGLRVDHPHETGSRREILRHLLLEVTGAVGG
jgi:hypothetical protein